MYNNHCLICKEKNKFNSKVFTTQNILRHLSNIYLPYKKFDIKEDRREIASLKSTIVKYKTMCPSCHRINQNKYIYLQGEIIQITAKIKAIIKSGYLDIQEQKKLKRKACEVLRGYYPILANYIQNIHCSELMKTE